MTAADVLAQYHSRLAEIQALMERAGARATSVGVVCAIAVALTVLLIFQAHWWTALVSGAVAAAAGWRFLNARAAGYQQWRLKQFYERAVKRVQGDWAGKGSTGEAWDDPNHAYAHDLNLFGQGSLFELLSIGRSGIGQHGLANCILTPVTIEQTRARQEAVRELRDRADLREQIALLGPHTFSESSWETFTDWLESPAITFPRALAPVLLITSVVLGCLALGAVGAGGTLLPWIWLFRLALPLVVFHAVVGLWFQERVKAAIASVGNLSSETQVLREGLELLEREPFQSPLLKQLAASAHGGAHALRKLERLLKGLRERNQDWFLHVSRLLMIGTQLSFAIEKWRRRHGSGVQAWMEAWAEFEALNALGGYAHENPDNIFPEFVDGGPRFEALALGHPLLSRDACIRNDVELNPGCRFYIVSGSNMSGKSTLLRSIGQNAVLAAAGAPVRAEALRLSRLAICASLNVADSLLNGKSKFLAEVERLRLAIETARGDTPVLFLVDEIFSGTNSSDRRIAAEAVVRTLISRGAIGALSTHDLALTEMAGEALGGANLHGANVHMGSRDQGDPMDFDYKLKPGVTREANALAIAKMAGVPV